MNRFPGTCGTALLTFSLSSFAEIPQPTGAPPPMRPEESAAAFKLPDGFRMEVVASEPLIASPSAVCWDERGRMFVSELHGYNLEGQLDIEELNKTGKLDTQVRRVQADEKFKQAAKPGTFGVVKMLRDTDGDGRMDKADTWARDLPPAYGLVPARGGVIVACAPDIVFLADPDGDGVAEVREILFTGFRTGALERGINAPQWGGDGWVYFGRGWGGSTITGPKLAAPVALPDSDFRIRVDGSAIEPVTGATGTFGFAMTESGDRFVVNTTIPAIYVAPLPWRYLVRNSDAAVSGLEASTGDRRAWSISKPHPWRQRRADDPAYFKYYNSRYGAAESDADGWFTAACGPMVYLDHALPGLHGQYFVCEPAGNLVHRALIEADGALLKVRRAPGEEKSEFAASRDSWSHPMNLTHGPDGALWVTDYYREIIEDYSAIPRHLQQQYGVYHGHDRGRIYRLTHRDLAPSPAADMSTLDAARLARETASALLWRRQTAQRVLVERGEKGVAPVLRELLAGKDAAPSSIIAALHTLDGLGALGADDTVPFLSYNDSAVRIHALQLADRWFSKDAAALDAALAAAAREENPRVLLQFAMSLGETRDPRAFAVLAKFAREHLDIHWMDAALMSSLHARGAEMLISLLPESGSAGPLLEKLGQSIAARGDEREIALALACTATAPVEVKAKLQAALAKARKIAPQKTPADGEPAAPAVSNETFRKYTAALAAARDAKRGHEIFTQSCAICHRIGNEGHVFGPDLLGELGVAEETLVRSVLLPNEHIRPGYETVLVELHDGTSTAGVLKDDGATGLTLLAPGGVAQVLLRKDVAGTHRLVSSLMPSFAEVITPADLANLLAWLRSELRAAAPPLAPEPEWFTAIKAAYALKTERPKEQPPMPQVNARVPSGDYNYGELKFGWNGVSIVWDAVNGEALFLCGHNGGMPFGTMGSWVLTDGGKTWRELKSTSSELDPLREKALAARKAAKAGEGAARGIFSAALDPAQEAAALKGAPAKLLTDAVRLAEELSAALQAAVAAGWEKESVSRAGARVLAALGALTTAHASIGGGKLDAETLKQCFDAQWALDEAADCLASSPTPRENASAVFEPMSKCVVLFGGSHHDFMLNDTWLYDCAKKSWRQAWPKTAPSARMDATFSRAADGKLTLSGGQTVLNKMVYQKGEMPAPAGEWSFDTASGEWIGEGGAAPGTRIYRTIVPGYDPRWYDSAPRGDRAATEDWLAKLPPNTWTAVPAQPAPAPEREWGNAVFDPDRDQIYRWTGGHQADPSSAMSTYHPALNRWSIPFVSDIILARKGMTFTGRPDCANHTYLHSAYDPISRRVICPSMGGTGVFDPDSGDFEFSVEQPFNRKIYQTCAIGTPRGVVLWSETGKMFIFNYAARAWEIFPLTGQPPRPVTDGSTFCYDAKREALWIASFRDYQKASGNIWRCDLKTGVIEAMNPANADSIGMAKGFNSEIRESIYAPTADLVLFNNFVDGREVAYDTQRNRWVTLNIAKNLERLGTVSDTLTWDPKRLLVWNLNAYKAIYVLKIDPTSVVLSDTVEK